MQDQSAAFETAVAKGEVDWAAPILLADWLEDGVSQLSAGQPAYILDQFNNRHSDSTWTRPKPNEPGKAYVHSGGSNSDYTIPANLGYARFGWNAVNATRRAFIETASPSMLAYTRWTPSADLTGTGEVTLDLVVFDAGPDTNHYCVRMEVNVADDTIDLLLLERSGGSLSTLQTENNVLTYVFGHVYAMLIQVNTDGLLLRAKVWDEDVEIEPVEWQLEHTITSLVSGGNNAGIRCTMPSTITTPTPLYVHFLEFRVIDGSIDDLSDLVGLMTIEHTLDDGLPNEVSFVQNLGTATLGAKLLHGRGGLTAQQYLSSHNPNSPLYDLARDVAPVTLDYGIITSDGPERTRLFTGKMVDLPIGTDQTGQLVATSATRLKLSKLVQPPPFNRAGDLSASWIVSWAAFQCGIYAAPNPSPGCIWYAPMHGSMQPFVDFQQPTQVSLRGTFPTFDGSYYRDTGDGYSYPLYEGVSVAETIPAYVNGPYVAAPALQFTSDLAIGIYHHPISTAFAADGSIDMLSEAGPRGRFEFAVRGDPFDAAPPGGSDFAPATFIVGLFLENDPGPGSVFCGINMSRELRIELSDGTASINLSTAAAFDLPSDGRWYRYGIAWDFAAETVYYYFRDEDGNEAAGFTTEATLDVTRLPAEDEIFGLVEPFVDSSFLEGGAVFTPYFHAFLPVSELHITAGTNANPNNAPWIWEDDYGFEASAIIKRSAHRLRVVAEPAEREAWELISSFAQAEMAMMRIDEQDRLLYLTPQYWVEEAQQTETQTLDTEVNVGELVPQVDPTRIRNEVRVAYREVTIDSLYQPMFQSRDVIAFAPGTTQFVIPLQVLASEVSTSLATLPSGTQIDNGVSGFLSGGFWPTFFTINTEPDGSGTYMTGPVDPSTDPIYIQVLDAFGANFVVVEAVNQTNGVLYTANDNVEVPTINIGGIGAYFGDKTTITSRASSITRRGTRGLPVDMPQIQRDEDAQRLAQRLLNELAEPSPTLESVRLFGDPRRQPGDLVQFRDARGTAVSGSWRLLSVRHVIDGANYYQEGRLRQALSVGEWQESGASRWGQSLWGREGL